MAGKELTTKDIERITLIELIVGFEHQCLAIPVIVERMLRLEGSFTKKEFAEAKKLFKDIMATKINNKNLTVCQLASMYLVAELSMQRMVAHPIQQPGQQEPELHKHTGLPPGYG